MKMTELQNRQQIIRNSKPDWEWLKSAAATVLIGLVILVICTELDEVAPKDCQVKDEYGHIHQLQGLQVPVSVD